jgi:hypothetical protein
VPGGVLQHILEYFAYVGLQLLDLLGVTGLRELVDLHHGEEGEGDVEFGRRQFEDGRVEVGDVVDGPADQLDYVVLGSDRLGYADLLSSGKDGQQVGGNLDDEGRLLRWSKNVSDFLQSVGSMHQRPHSIHIYCNQ